MEPASCTFLHLLAVILVTDPPSLCTSLSAVFFKMLSCRKPEINLILILGVYSEWSRPWGYLLRENECVTDTLMNEKSTVACTLKRERVVNRKISDGRMILVEADTAGHMFLPLSALSSLWQGRAGPQKWEASASCLRCALPWVCALGKDRTPEPPFPFLGSYGFEGSSSSLRDKGAWPPCCLGALWAAGANLIIVCTAASSGVLTPADHLPLGLLPFPESEGFESRAYRGRLTQMLVKAFFPGRFLLFFIFFQIVLI